MASSGKTLLKYLFVFALVAALGAGAYYYYQRNQAEAKVPEYTTTTVTRGDVIQVITATGQLDAVLSVDVGSQISGLIKELHVDFNSPVKKDQLLAEIDPATYQQKLRQADASLASAQAAYNLAELNANRTQELFAKSLVTQQEHDQAQVQLQQAKAQLLINQATVENARVDLSRCAIYSPIDGTVIAKLTEVGKTVAASLNVPTLFTIANDLSKMQITAAVAEADIGVVEEGQTVNFTADAFPNRNFQGTVTQVRNAPKTVSNVVTYDTIISVDNRDLKLRPGMTANVSIVVSKREHVLRVPNAVMRVRIPDGLAVVQKTADGVKTVAAAAPAAPAEGGRQASGGGRAFFANMTPEQREKMRAINAEVGVDYRQGPPTPEQREQIRKLMVERGVITAEQAAEMAGRRSSANGEPVYTTRTVYRLPGGTKAASPEAVSVKVGITDGLVSEIAEGVAEGDVLITSVTVPGAKPGAAPAANPFAGQRRF